MVNFKQFLSTLIVWWYSLHSVLSCNGSFLFYIQRYSDAYRMLAVFKVTPSNKRSKDEVSRCTSLAKLIDKPPCYN